MTDFVHAKQSQQFTASELSQRSLLATAGVLYKRRGKEGGHAFPEWWRRIMGCFFCGFSPMETTAPEKFEGTKQGAVQSFSEVRELGTQMPVQTGKA